MIFYSTSAVQIWPHPWNRLSILTACIIPLILVFVWKIPEWIKAVDIKKELLFVPVIVLLGVLNIVFSESRDASLKSMINLDATNSWAEKIEYFYKEIEELRRLSNLNDAIKIKKKLKEIIPEYIISDEEAFV